MFMIIDKTTRKRITAKSGKKCWSTAGAAKIAISQSVPYMWRNKLFTQSLKLNDGVEKILLSGGKQKDIPGKTNFEKFFSEHYEVISIQDIIFRELKEFDGCKLDDKLIEHLKTMIVGLL